MIDSSDPRLGYLAGYFDGEGCITVMSIGGGRSAQLRITIVSADQAVVDLFGQAFDQKSYEVTKSHLQKHSLKRRLFRWSISGARAVPVLRLLQPHLIAKKSQAIAALSVDWETHARPSLPGAAEISSRRWWAKSEITRLGTAGWREEIQLGDKPVFGNVDQEAK